MKVFWLGLGVGVGLGILLAPKSGQDTRNELWQRILDWRGSEGNFSTSDVGEANDEFTREASHDQTLADSFPTSDPPSSIPDPSGDASAIAS